MKFFALFLSLFVIAGSASAGETEIYENQKGQIFEGYVAYPDSVEFKGVRPLILVAHQWKGLGEYEKKRADMLADLGYIAFAVDVYGQGIRPSMTEEAKTESSKYKNEPDLARERMMTALNHAKGLRNADTGRIAVFGYCFGGTMALELARAGADIDAVISFHGGLATDKKAQKGTIKPAIQIHHGEADPHVSQAEIEAFIAEMNNAEADWHMISYADAVHAFTEKEAGNDPSTGAAYNEKADKRSWAYTLEFLEMMFSERQDI